MFIGGGENSYRILFSTNMNMTVILGQTQIGGGKDPITRRMPRRGVRGQNDDLNVPGTSFGDRCIVTDAAPIGEPNTLSGTERSRHSSARRDNCRGLVRR